MKNVSARLMLRFLGRFFIICLKFCLVALFCTGCTSEKDKKIDELTKKVDELTKSKNDQNNLIVMKLQEKCSKETEIYFNKEYGKDGYFSYTNHYNKKLNKCFMLLSHIGVTEKITSETLNDHFENKEYGDFHESFKNGSPEVIYCKFLDKHCTSRNEWDSLVKPYMEE